MKTRPLACALLATLAIGTASAEELAAFEKAATRHGEMALESSVAAITENDLRSYVNRLASAEYEGRGTGDPGERMATAYLARFFEGLGLTPEGDEGGFFQSFDFNTGRKLSGTNTVTLELAEPLGLVRRFEPGIHYQPVPFSKVGTVPPAPVVFAGFGIAHEDYDSYEGLAVEGAWVVVFRGNPSDRKELSRHGPLVNKAAVARDKGAAGIIFVKGSNPAIASELIDPGTSVGAARGGSLPALTITNRLAAALLTGRADETGFTSLFERFDQGGQVTGFPLPYRLAAEIGLEANQESGRNVLARLQVGEEPSDEVVVIGAHIDHLGYGTRGGTRARGEEASQIHVGADDNASGVAAMMEVAQVLAQRKKAGDLKLNRDIVFGAWSGEEMGLYGSRHFVARAKEAHGEQLHPSIATYLNLDMVGRLEENGLSLHGTASSEAWKDLLAVVNEDADLTVNEKPSPHLPSDTAPFYGAGIPILAAFTGLHDDYHTPRDTIDKIDFPGLGKVSEYLLDLTEAVAALPEAPGYVKVPRGNQGNLPKVRVGIMSEDLPENGGVRVLEVVEGSPAAKAGLQQGDVLTSFNEEKVGNLQALRGVLRKLEAGKEYPASGQRDGQELKLKITPEARE